ncbi:MAG: cupin [Phycisphaeraceae bacterium]|nr:cupin [Phycisphaeraceae bacterium]
MPFIRIDDYEPIELAPGARARTPYGEHVMLSYLELDEGSVIPAHEHPHEQAGMLIEGELDLTIGDETRRCQAGDLFIIPPNTRHAAQPVNGRAVVLDVFSPVREDYAEKFNRYIPPVRR